MRDGLHVRRPVTLLDEETLVVLSVIGRSGYRVGQPIGMVVGHRHTRPLLEVRGRDELEEGRCGHAGLLDGAPGIGRHEVRDVQAIRP